MTKKVNLQIEVEECPYWDYEKHISSHDCHSCNCEHVGNTWDNVDLGVMIDGDKYCTLECGVLVEFAREMISR